MGEMMWKALVFDVIFLDNLIIDWWIFKKLKQGFEMWKWRILFYFYLFYI